MATKGAAVSILLVVSVVVFWGGQAVQASVITNPSFESGQNGPMPLSPFTTELNDRYQMPNDWNWAVQGAMNGHGIHKNDKADGWTDEDWLSEQDWALYVFAAVDNDNPQIHDTGDYVEFYQMLNLTGVDWISFDAWLLGGSYTNSYVSIDFNKVWSENTEGIYSETIITSTLSGVHRIALGVEAFADFGVEVDGLTYFDNLVIPEPCTLFLLGLGGLGLLAKGRRQS